MKGSSFTYWLGIVATIEIVCLSEDCRHHRLSGLVYA
jgi:hypothetical protein